MSETTAESFSLNEVLTVQRAQRFEETPIKMRMPHGEPDALKQIDQSTLEQRKQPRQANAQPSSLHVACSSNPANSEFLLAVHWIVVSQSQ
jgi:hypothetical protein